MYPNDSAIHSGNYYTTGVKRVLAKLLEFGVKVPSNALEYPLLDYQPMQKFTNIEHAMLDWFEGRDYKQAQSLIHFKQPINDWHVICVIDQDHQLREVTDRMICPTLLDAVAAIIFGADNDASRIECENIGDSIVVAVDGIDTVRIDPLSLEPFNLSIRDRVRTAFKGARDLDRGYLMSYASKLPGFKDASFTSERPRINPDALMFLGYPSNWSLAMRNALKQVDIDVKQNQAQELAAVFFGAANWHQLIKHQDELNSLMMPVDVMVKSTDGERHNFYCTTEEAVFAVGNAIKSYPKQVTINHLGLTLSNERVFIMASDGEPAMTALGNELNFSLPENCIESGGNDYWSMDWNGATELEVQARKLLSEIS